MTHCRSCQLRVDKAPLAGGCKCRDPYIADPEDTYPAEIVMANGPNIVVHSRQHEDAIRAAMRNNSTLP